MREDVVCDTNDGLTKFCSCTSIERSYVGVGDVCQLIKLCTFRVEARWTEDSQPTDGKVNKIYCLRLARKRMYLLLLRLALSSRFVSNPTVSYRKKLLIGNDKDDITTELVPCNYA